MNVDVKGALADAKQKARWPDAMEWMGGVAAAAVLWIAASVNAMQQDVAVLKSQMETAKPADVLSAVNHVKANMVTRDDVHGMIETAFVRDRWAPRVLPDDPRGPGPAGK